MTLGEIIEAFPWESEEQKKGYLALVQYFRQFGKEPIQPFDLLPMVFMIQKNIDSHEYWREAVANQIKPLQDDLHEKDMLISTLLLKVEGLQIAIQALTKAN